MAAGSAGGNACTDYRAVLERVVGIRLNCRDYYWPGVLAKIYRKAENQKQRKELGLIVTLTFFSMLFWAFAQQGGSSISLYIDRFVNRDMFGYTVPTAMFQSINAFAVMLCGVFLAWVVKESVAGNRTVRIWGKFALGLGLMSAGFCILTLSARWSAMYGHSSLPLMVLGLAVMGFAELFIDPVAMSQITRIEIPGVTGVLTGIYMLLSGAIANYLAGVIADQTSQASFDASGAINYSINAYIEVFDQITGRTGVCRTGTDDLAVSGAEIQKPRAGAGILIGQHHT